jgi:hypothetical protein
VVKRSSRRARLFSSTFSTLMLESRLPIVPVDSSAARIPFPGVPMYAALAMSSSEKHEKLIKQYDKINKNSGKFFMEKKNQDDC